MSYFSAVKNWLYSRYPGVDRLIERDVHKITNTIDRRLKSQGQATPKQAPACTKSDLEYLARSLLSHASSEDDYSDSVLLVHMWHLFGRSSDMAQLCKRSFSIHPGGSLNVRFGRVKTSLQQGLSHFPDLNMWGCPIHCLAVALVVDIVPAE